MVINLDGGVARDEASCVRSSRCTTPRPYARHAPVAATGRHHKPVSQTFPHIAEALHAEEVGVRLRAWDLSGPSPNFNNIRDILPSCVVLVRAANGAAARDRRKSCAR